MTEYGVRDGGCFQNVSPPAIGHRSFEWRRGRFDMARRAYTDAVEGVISSGQHLVMATLRGGAARHEIRTDCGHRYDGPDRPGVVSFLPAHCARRLRLTGVAWEWASIALPPSLFDECDGDRAASAPLRSFSNVRDPFLFGLLAELERLLAFDGALDGAYCDAMSYAVAHYLRRRLGGAAADADVRLAKLPAWRLRRIADYVEAHLGEEIRIAALAALVGVSEGHLHRAFRATTGRTPLQYVNEKRVERAIDILLKERPSIADVAFRVGFSSHGHFTRTFRSVVGVSPSEFLAKR